MSCGAINPANTYLWLTLGGILAGGGLSFILAPRKRRRPAVFASLLSISIILLLASEFLDDFSTVNISFRLWWLGGSFLLGYIGFFFWKIVGIPLIFISVVFVSLSWYAFFGWFCAVPGSEICRFNIISEGENFIRIQHETAGGVREIELIEGKTAFTRLNMISLPEYYFILRSGVVYNFQGFENTATASGSVPGGIIMKWLLKLPGFEYFSPRVAPSDTEGSLAPSVDYSLIFNSDKYPEIIRIMSN